MIININSKSNEILIDIYTRACINIKKYNQEESWNAKRINKKFKILLG